MAIVYKILYDNELPVHEYLTLLACTVVLNYAGAPSLNPRGVWVRIQISYSAPSRTTLIPAKIDIDGLLRVAHDDVIKWKHFPRHWPFMRGIHRS